jgi:uncharacterized caspase-like protein
MRVIATIVMSIFAVCAVPASAAEARIALVVGNDQYEGGLKPLANAVNDATLISRALTKAGFDVEPLRNAGRTELAAAIARFTQRLKQAGPDAVGLFYFAGHGLQYRGTNYLLASDANLAEPADISRKGLDAVQVLWALQDGGAATSILILDACRLAHVSTPLEPIAEEGLSRIDKKGLDKRRNVLVAYSTGPGETATDGAEREGNSPFAKILSESIPVPDQGIVDMFFDVSAQMVEHFDQRPWLDVGWPGREKFYFVSGS